MALALCVLLTQRSRFNRRAWFHKDSVGTVVKGVKTSDVINILNDAVAKDQDCFIILTASRHLRVCYPQI